MPGVGIRERVALLLGRGVVLDDAERNLDLEGRLAGTWSVWGEV